MADEQQAGAGLAAFGEEQLEKRLAAVGVERRGRLVGDHQLRLADQRAGGGDPLLLADGQAVGAAFVQFAAEAELAEQMAGGLRRATVAFAGALTAQRGKVTGQLDVLAYREEWQQVELLEDVAGVVDAEMVAARGGQLFQVLAEQADAAAAGLLHAAEEAEQGGLAAAGRPLEEQALAAFEMEAGNVQQLRLAGPGEAEVGQGDQCAHGGRGGTLRRSLEWMEGRRAESLAAPPERSYSFSSALAGARSAPFWPSGPISCT